MLYMNLCELHDAVCLDKLVEPVCPLHDAVCLDKLVVSDTCTGSLVNRFAVPCGVEFQSVNITRNDISPLPRAHWLQTIMYMRMSLCPHEYN